MFSGRKRWKIREVCPFMGRAGCPSREQGRVLALAYMYQRESGPSRVAEAIADTALVCGEGLENYDSTPRSQI